MSGPNDGARLSAVTPRRAAAPTGRRLERDAIPGGVKTEAMLDGSMTKNDLIWSLEHLSFGRSSIDPHQRATVSLDRAVRDFLVRALRSR
jgi:hypothetical protein